MEAVLLAAVGAGELVPGEAVGGANSGRGRRTRLVLQYLLVAGQTLGVRRRLDGRLEMQRAVAGTKMSAAGIGQPFAVTGLTGVRACLVTVGRGGEHNRHEYPFDGVHGLLICLDLSAASFVCSWRKS